MATRNGSVISFSQAKKKMAVVWLLFSAAIFTLFIILTITKFGEESQVAWNWLLPSILPTLSLIIGILVTDAKTNTPEEHKVNKFYYYLALGFSIFYLSLLFCLILFHGKFPIGIDEMFRRSNLFLAPIQGLVSAVIGIFYYKST